MFRVRRIHDQTLPVNREALAQARDILVEQFAGVGADEFAKLGEEMANPFRRRFRTIMFVAEDMRRNVRGCAVVLHDPVVGFCFLEYIAALLKLTGGGIGDALYSRVREAAAELGATGLFMECLPDDPALCPDPVVLAENVARLRFYERFGVRPIVGTEYEAPITPGGDACMPHLVFDGLDRTAQPDRAFTRKVVTAVLERKYGDLCPPEYVKKVVHSITDDPVRLREPRHVKPNRIQTSVTSTPSEPVALLINDRHDIHHVRDRGYVESPVRIKSILSRIEPSGLFETLTPRSFGDRHVKAVHDSTLVDYLKRACETIEGNKSLYPYVFPLRNRTRPPREPDVLSGYFCMDTFTPIHKNAYIAARRAVDCTLTAAREVLEGRRVAYSLVRPPGHHAERRVFGGFCYLNNSAIAAHYLGSHIKVAMLDVDYHHGNGQQDIFYHRPDVLTVSIHGHPRFAYPYFSGFEDEVGEGPGEGFNLNIPLPESRTGKQHAASLTRALTRIDGFGPGILVVPLGLDTAQGDPTGTWSLGQKDFETMGAMIGELGLPVLVVQEGGYRTRSLGGCALSFFTGLVSASQRAKGRPRRAPKGLRDLTLRTRIRPEDREIVRTMIESTHVFYDHEIAIALELVDDALARPEETDYKFLFADGAGETLGYACYGRIPCTESSWDLYWIAVKPDCHGQGVGRGLMGRVEWTVRQQGGTRIYVETSGRPAYAPTRGFYELCGYTMASGLDDFYGPGDARITYVKVL